MPPNRRKPRTVADYFLVLLVAAALAAPPARATDDLERAQLAGLLRQLDQLERSATHSETLARDATGTRYHFDYMRLRRDIDRVRTGIQRYLTPSRAQPREATSLLGDYRREATPIASDTGTSP